MPFFGSSNVTTTPAWVRPSDWLTLPTLATTDNRFVGLFAVTDDSSNLVALSATGAYSVDWGDGSAVENIATGVVAQHQYNYATLGNLSTLGYKQAIISVTPQAGQTFTSLSLQKTPTGYSTATIPWLDIAIAGTSLTSFIVSATSIVVTLSLLRQCTIISLAPTYNVFGSMFNKCPNLGNVNIPFSSTAAGTGFGAMFSGCSSLTTVPLFNTAAGTGFGGMFSNCPSLTTVPLFNTAAGTNFASMFSGCSSLTTVPLFNTAAGTNFLTMFSGCSSLTTVPLFNTAAGTGFGSMFSFCPSLTTVPLFNTAAGTSFNGMFLGCSSLTTIPLFNTAAGTNFGSMFSGCPSLNTVPAFNVSNAIAASSLTDFILGTTALSSFNATGARQSISFAASPKLAYPQLQAILANLGTAVAGSIVNISGTYGQPSITAADRLVATNKGWIVTG